MIKKLITYKSMYLVHIVPETEKLPPMKTDYFAFTLDMSNAQVDFFKTQKATTYVFYPTNALTREQILCLQSISQREILFFVACAFKHERLDMAKELLLSSMHKDFIVKFHRVLKKKHYPIAYDHIMAYLKEERPTMSYERPFEQIAQCDKNTLFNILKEHYAYIDKENDDIQPAQWNRDIFSFIDKDQIRVRIDQKYIDSFEDKTGLNHLKWVGGETTDYYTFEIILQP
jgi:hypothetical protein